MNRKRKEEENLFQEFMEYMKRRKHENSPKKLQDQDEDDMSDESEWPVEYLDLDDSFEEGQGKQEGGVSDQNEEAEEEEEKKIKPEKIVIIEDEEELDEELLLLLGKEKENELEKAPKIHKDVANRWNNIIEKGMDKEEKLKIQKKYPPIENMPRLVTPKLNPEAEAAMGEPAKKRDRSISTKQRKLAVATSALGGLLSDIISTKENTESNKKGVVTKISDAGRILCDLFYEENKIRRFCALESMNKDMRASLQAREPEEFLFGKNLADGIRTAKAVARAAQDLKPKSQPKGRLNAQGPLRPNNQPFQGRVGRGPVQKKPSQNFTQRKKENQDRSLQRQGSQNHQRTRTHHR